jgi:hypothetical protein
VGKRVRKASAKIVEAQELKNEKEQEATKKETRCSSRQTVQKFSLP